MRGYFLIIAAFSIWSTWGLAVRWLDKPTVVTVFYNALFAAAFQGAGLYLAGRRRPVHLGRELGPVLLMAFFALANILLFFYALKATTIAIALLTHYTAPVIVAVLAPWMLKDRMGRPTLAALTVSVLGLLLIFLKGIEISGETGLLGALAGTGSGVAYAMVILFSRGLSPRHHPLKLAFFQSLVAVLAVSPFVAGTGALGISVGQALLFAVLGLVHSTAALALYLYGIREATAQEAGVLGYLEPVLAVMLAYVFLGERPNALALAGGVMIVVSGFLVIATGGRSGIGGLNDNRG